MKLIGWALFLAINAALAFVFWHMGHVWQLLPSLFAEFGLFALFHQAESGADGRIGDALMFGACSVIALVVEVVGLIVEHW